MVTSHAVEEAGIRERIGQLAEAIRAMDLERVMSMFAPDVVSDDLEPPLQHIGAAAKRKNWKQVFTIYQRPLGYEIRNLMVAVGDDVAFGHSLNRISGTLKNGKTNELWLRWTACLRKIDGQWLIAHDQVSVPLDVASGRGLVDLEP